MIAADAVPHLPRGVRLRRCDIRDGWFLLAPERAVKLDQIAVHILQALNGERSFQAVVEHLASKFDAPADRIAQDAGKFLNDMQNRQMVALS